MQRRNVNHSPRSSSAAREIGPDDPTIQEVPTLKPEAANDAQADVVDLDAARLEKIGLPEPHVDLTHELVHERIPESSIEHGGDKPLEQLQQEADAENAARLVEQRAKVKAEFAQMQRSEALDAAAKYDAHRQKQAVELRRREVKLQNDINALGFFDFRKKRELKRQLTITTERLNGLTQSTPEMRRLQRRSSVADTVQDAVPGRRRTERPRVEDPRPKHMQARDEMHAAAAKRDKIGFFGRLFGKKKVNRARADVYGTSNRYAKLYRKGEGQVEISEAEVVRLNRQSEQMDEVRNRRKAG